MSRPYPPHRSDGIPTLTQRAEPTLSPDASLPQDDDTPVLGDVYLGPDDNDDVPVLEHPAGDPFPDLEDDAASPPPTAAEIGPAHPYSPWGDRPAQARLRPGASDAGGPLAAHPARDHPLGPPQPYTAHPEKGGYPSTPRAGHPARAAAPRPPGHTQWSPSDPDMEPVHFPAPPATPAHSGPSVSASIPEAVLRAALQAEIEQAVQAAVADASAMLRARLEAELPAIVARTLGRIRPG